jgi:hypothetical protein
LEARRKQSSRTRVFAVGILLMMTVGMMTVVLLTYTFDMVTFGTYDAYRDENGRIPDEWWQRYLTQAVESYVLGAALGIVVTIGLVGMWLGMWIRNG